MIGYKKGICPQCGPDSKIQSLYAKGLCYNHYWQSINKQSAAKKNSPKSLVNQNLNQTDKQELQEYFLYHVKHSGTTCENCNSRLFYPTTTIAFSCQAHIVPKSLFPSVKANIHNHLTLGGLFQPCSCHGQYDSSWENAQKMPVFEIAKSRFLLFKHLIAKPEVKKLPEPFYNLYYN